MINKTERNLECYLQAGADLRLFKAVSSKLIKDLSGVLYAKDTDQLLRLVERIELLGLQLLRRRRVHVLRR